MRAIMVIFKKPRDLMRNNNDGISGDVLIE
jgi:hypothetical protein